MTSTRRRSSNDDDLLRSFLPIATAARLLFPVPFSCGKWRKGFLIKTKCTRNVDQHVISFHCCIIGLVPSPFSTYPRCTVPSLFLNACGRRNEKERERENGESFWNRYWERSCVDRGRTPVSRQKERKKRKEARAVCQVNVEWGLHAHVDPRRRISILSAPLKSLLLLLLLWKPFPETAQVSPSVRSPNSFQPSLPTAEDEYIRAGGILLLHVEDQTGCGN